MADKQTPANPAGNRPRRPSPETCNHVWVYTGTAYGGDDERWHGEGRCYCELCGEDGDA